MRGLATVALLAYLLTALGLGFDRIADADPRLANLVPGPAQVGILEERADRFVEAGVPGSALADAELLVRRDPVSLHGTGLLGAARLGRGDQRGADAAFRIAARLGWRDARTQLYWLRLALARQDHARAALHYAALARQWPDAPAIINISALFEATAAGRSALASRIAAGDSWALAYAAPPEGSSPQAVLNHAKVLGEAAGLGRILGCETIAPLARSLVPIDPAEALRVWRAHCPDEGFGGLLHDGDFRAARPDASLGPFAWEFAADGAFDLRLEPEGAAARSVVTRNDGAILRAFAAQRVVLGQGGYRVWLKQGSSASLLFASLSCGRDRLAAQPVALTGMSANLEFPGGCPAPWFQLWLAPRGQAQVTGLRLDRL